MNIYIFHTQRTELPKDGLACPVNLIDLNDSNSYEMIRLSNEKTIIFYESPLSILASLLRAEMEIVDVIKAYEQRVNFLVTTFKASREKVRLISVDEAFKEPDIVHLKECSSVVNVLKKIVKIVEHDLHDIAANLLFLQNRSLLKSAQLLAACSEVPFKDIAIDINYVLNSYRVKNQETFQNLERVQVENKQVIEQLHHVQETLENKLEKAEVHNKTKIHLEQELAHSQNVLKTEQKLTKQQAAELQSINEQLAQEQKASKEQAQNLTNKLKQVEEENELIIQQLHHVQEELEYQFISKSELTKQHSIVSSSKRDAQTYSYWLKGLYHKATKEHYKANRRYRNILKKQMQLITQSTLFDEQWYLDTYPDLREAKIEPALHYLLYGVAEGRNPSASFNTMNYIFTYTDVAESGLNPLVHFIKFGQAENREADPRRKCLPAPKNNQ